MTQDTMSLVRSLVSRVENIEDEISVLNADKADIYKEAKGQGINPKALKQVVAYRRKDQSEAQSERADFELYLEALLGAGTVDATRVYAREAAE